MMGNWEQEPAQKAGDWAKGTVGSLPADLGAERT